MLPIIWYVSAYSSRDGCYFVRLPYKMTLVLVQAVPLYGDKMLLLPKCNTYVYRTECTLPPRW